MEEQVRKATKSERREWVTGWLFVSPIALGLLIWTLVPSLASFALSMTRYKIVTPPRWVGLSNYARMLQEPVFVKSLKVTFSYVLMQLPPALILALLLAILLNTGVRGMVFFRTCYYVPAVVPAVATALVWSWLLNMNYGLVNQVLRLIGLKPVNFFGNPKTALPAMAVMGWFSIGRAIVIFLAGLLNVPPSLYEAAQIDGAGAVRRFFTITLPMLSSTIFYMVVMGLIGSFQVFTQSYVLTSGGPLYSTYFYNLMIFEAAFRSQQMGYASALAWVLLVIILVFTLAIFRSSSAWVYYESAVKG